LASVGRTRGKETMPTLNQMRTAIDNFVTNKWPTIVARQENYRTNKGTYWQGLPTHLACPEHSNGTDGSKLGDRLDEGPEGQFSTWLNVFPEWLSDILPACVKVDVYDSPDGQGWVLTVEATHNGTKYRRSQNVGPESHRTQGWHIVPALPEI
jgi:hypothetical protein